MKHRIDDDVNVNVHISADLPKDDLAEVIDKVTDAAITIIVVSTAAHILKRLFDKA